MMKAMDEAGYFAELTDNQQRAVGAQNQNMLVTAGAGSGKTRTLVARYLALLQRHFSPRQIAAITFTEKAAREMRNRVRRNVAQWALTADSAPAQRRWQDLLGQMDAARIGTIHSLCAEILRTHPAEARVDPEFEVIDEGASATLRAQVIQDVLAWAAGDPQAAPLFRGFTSRALRRLLTDLLERRLDVAAVLEGTDQGQKLLQSAVLGFLKAPQVEAALGLIQRLSTSNRLVEDGGENLAAQIEALLAGWKKITSAVEQGNWVEAAGELFRIRRDYMDMRLGTRGSESRQAIVVLREVYGEKANPWLGGSSSRDPAPDPTVEETYQEILARLGGLFNRAVDSYRKALDSRYALDFDDLENKALALLGDESIRSHWQEVLTAVLVDEYQDTNQRQQQIISRLVGQVPGKLFVVGDARQSIYRFRGADVAGFQALPEEGGQTVELAYTFRAHPALVRASNGLLKSVLRGGEAGFQVPFSPLRPFREGPRQGVRAPFVEIVCGLGESAALGREASADVLAERLLELRDEDQVKAWDDVALLFRASTGFYAYEEALEKAGIPFITVAGRGFYERPEIRDVLNMLRALADPWDDLAMAGLLRSPAFGLRDESLYRLRWQNGNPVSFWEALGGDLGQLPAEERTRAAQAREVVMELQARVDRSTVAELIKSLVDRTCYRAVLASGEQRLWRNLNKLLQDAHASGLVRVREFMEYLETLREVGAREGEAPVEAGGAVRLMTVHKAKGLEFEVVVLADASRDRGSGFQRVTLLAGEGLAVHPNRLEAKPLIPRVVRWQDSYQEDAEENRLLYVALTRAREKLLISGHLTARGSGWQARGWLKQLFEIMACDEENLANSPGVWHEVELSSGEVVAVRVGTDTKAKRWKTRREVWPTSKATALFTAVTHESKDTSDQDPEDRIRRDWRATSKYRYAPALAVGDMVHAALQEWMFPDERGLEPFLEAAALREGLVDPMQRERAIQETIELLERLRADPRWEEIDRASVRYHEVPYSQPRSDGGTDFGQIDLLYQVGDKWYLVDFKTEALGDEEALDAVMEKKYHDQMKRYTWAVEGAMGVIPTVHLCFLDYQGRIKWKEVESA